MPTEARAAWTKFGKKTTEGLQNMKFLAAQSYSVFEFLWVASISELDEKFMFEFTIDGSSLFGHERNELRLNSYKSHAYLAPKIVDRL